MGKVASTAILFSVDRRTREFTIEELPEKQIRKMNRVDRMFDFMLKGEDDYLFNVAEYMSDGFAVYRIID